MSTHPEDILVHIFSWLPMKSILRFRCVCKAWDTLLRDPYFFKLHLKNHVIINENYNNNKNNFSFLLTENNSCGLLYNIDCDADASSLPGEGVEAVEINYPFKYPGSVVHILGSCNGLFCISINSMHGHVDNEIICLWNPTTNEYKKLPSPPPRNDVPKQSFCSEHGTTYGLGYDSKIDDYKLVRVTGPYNDFTTSEYQVYTLGSNSWTSIQYIAYCLPEITQHGVLVNGVLHWVGYDSSFKVMIVSFDIDSERFKDLPVPEQESDTSVDSLTAGNLGGRLCVIGTSSFGNYSHEYKTWAHVWVMQNHGVRESWARHSTLFQHGFSNVLYFQLIESFKNGEILLMRHLKKVILYDPENERARGLNIRGISDRPGEMWSYVRSLVSLNSSTYVGQEQ